MQTVIDPTRCGTCGGDVSGLTTAFDRVSETEVIPRHIGCEPLGPKCPTHKYLMDGGGYYWNCPVDGCDERVADTGDQL